jgi:autotransporter-associated beta strand protein
LKGYKNSGYSFAFIIVIVVTTIYTELLHMNISTLFVTGTTKRKILSFSGLIRKVSYSLFLIFFTSIHLFGQTTFSWRNDQNPVSGQWNVASYWWNGGAAQLPGGNEILFLDGNVGTTMTNDLPAASRYRIIFGAGGASRTLNGVVVNTFFDYSGNAPAIINNSGATQTVNFPILNGNGNGASRLEMNANTGNLVIGSTISANAGTRNLVAMGGANSSFTGVISSGAGTLNFIKEGAGTTTLSAANTYTGTTTITGGVLRLGAANTIPNTNMTLSGGTLSTGAAVGFNETVGVLAMTASSGISLGTGSHTLNFSNSNGTWTGTLTISGWSYGAGQIFFGNNNTGLSAAQLSQINFTGFGSGARILGTGEIVPANFYISNQTGNFNVGSTWVGGVVPPAGVYVVISNAHTVTLTGAITLAGIYLNAGAVFSLNGFNLQLGFINSNQSTATVNNNSVSNCILTVTDGGGNNCAAAMQDGSTGTLSFVKSGAGTQTLSGTNTYSGTTNVTGGTLGIGSTGSGAGLSVNSNYIFNGGSLSIANLPAASVLNAGTIDIQQNTSITLNGPNAYTVNFAASNGVAWNLASTVTVFNWTPSASRIIQVGTGTGLTAGQLGRVNFDNYGVGSKIVGIELRPAFLYVTQASGSGDYTNAGSWLLGDRPVLNNGTESIYIQPGFTLNMDVAAPTVNVLRAEVGTGAFLNMGVADIINIYATGDFRVNGTINMNNSSVINLAATTNFQVGGTVNMVSTSVINMAAGISMIATSASAGFSAAGILNFQGAFTITSDAPNAVLLPNVNLNASVNFGQNSTIQNGSSLFMNPGGFVNTNAPFYATGSNLVYKTGGNYNRSTEWSATTGRGYPHHVTVSSNGLNNTTLFTSNGTPGTERRCGGNLTIDANNILDMTDMSAAIRVFGNATINGTLELGSAFGGDLRITGDYTHGVAGTTINNNRAVIFEGSAGDQIVTKTGGGTIDFDYIVVNKSAGNVKMTINTNARIISNVNNDPGLRVLQLINGGIDMNGGLLTLQGDNENSLNILVSGGTRRIFTSTGSGEFRITGSNSIGVAKLSVISQSSGKLLFDDNVLVTTNVGVNFGPAGITTINAQLRIDQYGYVITNSPDYGPASTLIYNNGAGGYKRNMEWNTNTAGATGAGYPHDVIVQNSTPVELNSGDFPAPGPLGCSGSLIIQAGSSVLTAAMPYTLSVGDTLDIKGSLTLSTDAAGDLFVGGPWNRTGSFVQNDRMVTFDSTNAASIRALGGQLFSRMTVNKKTNGATLAIDSAVTISNELFLQRGAVNLNNDVTLLSDNTRTARVGETTNPANITVTYGAGKFVIQRYLPIANTAAARRWRMLTAPLRANNAPTINASWQEGQSSANRLLPSNSNPGFGTAITRSTVASNGYDQGSTNNPSIYSYNTGSNGWDALTATNTGSITDQPGYMLFVRGDRSIVVSNTSVPGIPTTLRSRGEINIGNVSTVLNPAGFQLLGNPYASAISFNNVSYNGVNPGTTAGRSFYLWDPKLPGANNVGGWITCTSLGGGVYSVTANGSGYPTDGTFTGTIESGAAIMVPAAGGNFIFTEPCKLTTSSTLGIASRPVSASNQHSDREFFTCNLHAANGIAAGKAIDGVIHIGSNDFDNEVNDRDAAKLVSFSGAEKISMVRHQQKLSVELRKKLGAGDTLFYHLSRLYKGDYKLAFISKGIDAGLVAIAEDKYTGTKTILPQRDTSFVSFAVTDDTASAAADRFSVVFRSAAAFTSLSASVINRDVVTAWNVSSEFGIASYEIERSGDGENFTTVGNRLSRGNSFEPVLYKWKDEALSAGHYYYRIRAVMATGAFIYSNTVKISLYRDAGSVYIFPNPVQGNTIHLRTNTLPGGLYTVRLFNKAGQVVAASNMNHTSGAPTAKFQTGGNIASGMYTLEITGSDGFKVVLQAIIE